MSEKLPRILIVDDERRMCRTIEILLREDGEYETFTASNYYEAMNIFQRGVDLVLTDLTMPGKTGLELLADIRREGSEIPVILMTAYSTVESAIEAMKEGAFDYLLKPFENDQLMTVVRRALGRMSAFQGKKESHPNRFGDLIGHGKAMQEVFFSIQRASETEATVLISGESGTGKELVARAIHFSGHRRKKPFVAINCAAIPETLLESELFGHEKGAFTGAIQSKLGKFELADEGTLFLDEIGEMDPLLQVKLLRAIQERVIEKVGATSVVKINVRIIAATNRNLEKAVDEGKFREDLFYRLNVMTIEIPPLRNRAEDIPFLIDHFLRDKTRRLKMREKRLTAEAREKLLSYSYPGNIRELENIIERAVIMSKTDQIEVKDLPLMTFHVGTDLRNLSIPIQDGFRILESVKEKLEKDIIERAIQMHPDKSNSEIAKLLGTSRRILESRLKRYDVEKN